MQVTPGTSRIYPDETIAAVATPPGAGGIGIIRISGDNALAIAGRCFRSKGLLKNGSTNTGSTSGWTSHTLYYGRVEDEKGQSIDEAMAVWMKAPRSYTCEDVVELHCHGGLQCVQSVLALTLRLGARLAQPGEFTKRAFLNGRLDLSQAEAVMDLIAAPTELAQKEAVQRLGGRFSRPVREIRERILTLLAGIEASIDYPEHDMEQMNLCQAAREAERLEGLLLDMADKSEAGRILKDGIATVIVGRPNVGKSSLLNALLDEERAIVTEVPGTTRDALTEYIQINGIPLKLTDTAGIRQTSDTVESIGVARARQLAELAELVLAVMDGHEGLTQPDEDILAGLSGQKVILIVNKSDLPMGMDVDTIQHKYPLYRVIALSAREMTGLEALSDAIRELFLAGLTRNRQAEAMAVSPRNKALLTEAAYSLRQVRQAAEEGMPEDVLAVDLMAAYRRLGEILGEEAGEDVIDAVFSRFCLGK